MYYIDTNVLVSYVFASDSGHCASRKVLEILADKEEKLYTSSFALVETCNAICRKIIKEAGWRLIDPLQRYVNIFVDAEERCRYLLSVIISFLKEKLNIQFVEVEDFYVLVPTIFNELKIPKIFKESIDLSYKLTIRIKDLLHLVYAFMLSKTHNIKYFLTRDVENFERIKDKVKQLLQIEIYFII